MHEGSPEALADELAELALAMLAHESVADELVQAMLADEPARAMISNSENFSGKNNGSGHCVVTAKCPSITSATH